MQKGTQGERGKDLQWSNPRERSGRLFLAAGEPTIEASSLALKILLRDGSRG